MATYANIIPTASLDGIIHVSSKVMPSLEVTLFNRASPPFADPIPVIYNQAVQAIVQFSITGDPDTNISYVVLQTDLGDGQWVDVAWVRWTATTGTAVFAMGGGVAGANAFQQSRAIGTAPGSSGSNQIPLGGRIRFTGKASLGTSASSSVGVGIFAEVTTTITYKLLGLR